MRLETFERQCYKLFFNEKLSKAQYFHVCSVVFMVKMHSEHGISPRRMWRSVVRCFPRDHNDNKHATIATWILPQMEQMDLQSVIPSYSQYEDEEEVDDDMRYLCCLVQFWKRFYEICDAQDSSRPNKRQRTTYSSSSNFGNLMKGRYKLPASYLLATIVMDCCCSSTSSWQDLHDSVHSHIPKHFKTFTADDVQAGMTLLGLKNIYKRQPMDGLTPTRIIQDYLSRTG